MGHFMLGSAVAMPFMQDGIAFNEEYIPERPVRLGGMMEEPGDSRPGRSPHFNFDPLRSLRVRFGLPRCGRSAFQAVPGQFEPCSG